jgi:hypothetical protein
MSIPILYKGESRLIVKNLVEEDGITPLALSSLNTVTAILSLGDAVVATYVHAVNQELRTGDTASQLILELTPTFTASLEVGTLSVRFGASAIDADFVASASVFSDVWEETLYKIR